MDAIESAHGTAKEMAAREKGVTQQALQAIAGYLDDAGGTLSDFADDPPTFEKFKADFAAQDDRRLKAISAANDSLEALQDAQVLIDKLLDSKPPEPEKSQLENADSELDGCVDAVKDAIKTMGGKVS
jgi:ABC-type transporter Mla subunit MlaD